MLLLHISKEHKHQEFKQKHILNRSLEIYSSKYKVLGTTNYLILSSLERKKTYRAILRRIKSRKVLIYILWYT